MPTRQQSPPEEQECLKPVQVILSEIIMLFFLLQAMPAVFFVFMDSVAAGTHIY